MKRTLLSCSTFALGAIVLNTSFAKENVIYGEDNRIETYEASKMEQKLAHSTAGMISTVKAVKVGDKFMLPPYTIKKSMQLCDGEKFVDQPSAVVCSGFLVGPDLLVTAGHCIQTQTDCQTVSWVFDYKVNKKNQRTDILVPAKNVYKCKKVIEAKLESRQTGEKIDYALVRLDRVVKGRTPLKFRSTGKVKMKQDIVVIGHPSGLPQKVAGGAQVLQNTAVNYFKTNLDTFGGNSGSAVFNADNGSVEGILVRGAKDYDQKGNCRSVHKTTQQITDFSKYGESVSRITDIKTLKYLRPFLKAASEGNLAEIKKLAPKMGEISIYDNDMNTALHLAAANNHSEVMSYLIEQKINIDAQNSKGETALHIAAYNNAKGAIKVLVDNDADTLIKDNFGNLARKRTNYLAFGTRKLLKETEEVQKKRKKKNI